MKLINKILEDFSTLDDVIATEVDDFQNPIHIIRLKEVMASYGIQDEVINPIIRTITEQDDDEDEEVTFKHDGKTRTITMKTARQYASDIKQGDDSEEKQAAVKAANLDSKDTKQDKEDSGEKLKPGDEYDDVDLPALLYENKGKPLTFSTYHLQSIAYIQTNKQTKHSQLRPPYLLHQHKQIETTIG